MTAPAAYPLTWPDIMPRSKARTTSKFKATLPAALENVAGSLRRFAGDTGKTVSGLVISSNVTLGATNPADPGVAVWFTWDGMQVCIAVDRYQKIADNLQATHHIIEARRTEMRHGGLHIVQATFRGFKALPSPDRAWRDVLEHAHHATATAESIDRAYKAQAKKVHPDVPGGSADKMSELNRARDAAMKEIGP